MWRETEYSTRASRSTSLRCESGPATCCRRCEAAAPADVGGRRQPRHVREGRPARPRRAALQRLGVAKDIAPLDRDLQGQHRRADPVGEYVNDNIMVTSGLVCLADGQAARKAACNMGIGYRTARCSTTTTHAQARGHADVAGAQPRADARGDRLPDQRGLPAVRRSRRGRRAGGPLPGPRHRPARVRPAARPAAGAGVGDDPPVRRACDPEVRRSDQVPQRRFPLRDALRRPLDRQPPIHRRRSSAHALPRDVPRARPSVHNWGRWGADDEIGTINLVTPRSPAGAACVRTGRAFSLGAAPRRVRGHPDRLVPGRVNPVRTMARSTRRSSATRPMLHQRRPRRDGPPGATHWDGLAHVSYDGHLWNGYPADSVTADGATRCGIHRIRTLVEPGRAARRGPGPGVDRLEGGH